MQSPAVPWSHDFCMGSLLTSGFDTDFVLARNTGGGTANCCAMHPIAAPARAVGSALQVQLEPLEAGKETRNGGRVYLADRCTEGAPKAEDYAAIPLLGRTLSVTVDVSGAGCGCNVAFYLSYLRGSRTKGQCDGDYYCDANEVCGLRCAEIDSNIAHRTLTTARALLRRCTHAYS